MASTQNVITIRPVLRLDLREAGAQRNYCVNEAANKCGRERNLLVGIVVLYDRLIEAALTARDGPPS